MKDDLKLLAALAVTGALIGIAKVLNSDEPIKLRTAIARAILSGALGVAAAAVVLLFPGVGFAAQVGVACILTSLGVSSLEVILKRMFASK